MERGGQPELELAHARRLLNAGAGDVWGWNSPAGKQRVEYRARWLTKVCSLKSGVNVLECGCGTGIFTKHLGKTGANITAVDISFDLLEEARKSCSLPNVTFTQLNLENPRELPDGHFDVLCGVSVLHHLMLPKALIALRDKLRSNARFAFSEPNLLNPINRYIIFSSDPAKRRKHGTSLSEMAFFPEELRTLFEKSGFEVRKLEHRDFLHPSVPRNLISIVRALQFFAERTPILCRWSGSLWISGVKR